MIEIKDKTMCMGCHACYSKCPVQAIKMVEDEKGFKYPIVNKEKCINCSLCERVCPILNKNKTTNNPEAYVVKNKNEKIREQSSSGGMFTLLAEKVLQNGGVVFGATFDEDWDVEHKYVENVEELQMFRGSKYVQSTIGSTYAKAKEFLLEGREVMFTGTPCQIEGLKSFLGRDFENLVTQDIICHGVPSPKVHKKYLEFVKLNYNSKKIEQIYHRSKNSGWKDSGIKIKLDNMEYIKSHKEDPYMQAFLRNTILRDSCYDCQFKNKNRISDITLADFWGIENIEPEMDDDKGTSLVIINSEKGMKIFEQLKDKIIWKKVNFEEAIQYNPSMTSSPRKDPNRKKFFDNLDKISFEKLVNNYTYQPSIIRKILRRIKKLFK